MHTWATLSIIRIDKGYVFYYQPPFDISGYIRFQALTGHTVLNPEHLTQRQAAIDLAVRMIGEFDALASTGESPDSLSTAEQLRSHCQILYRDLLPEHIRSALEQLPPEISLVIASNDNRFPWELMYTGTNFLALQRPVSRCPLTTSLSKLRPATPPTQAVALIIANPTLDLKLAEAEAQQLARLLPTLPAPVEPVLIAGKRATITRVKTELSRGDYAIIHYSGHTQPGALELYDGLLTLDDLDASLSGHPFVFLNGCQSARELALEPGENQDPLDNDSGVRDLAQAFLGGGAVGVVGTLWKIREDHSGAFATRFYRLGLNGETIGQALRQTRQHLQDDFPGGSIWAAYVCYGFPDQKILSSPRTRRQATVVSVRLPTLARPDENWSNATIETFERLTALVTSTITRFGGEIQAATPENVLATFRTPSGTPSGTGQDVERAMWAALEIVRRWQRYATKTQEASSNVRQLTVGLETGEVASNRLISLPPRKSGPHLIAGQPTQQALWLAQQARPTQILVGPKAHQAGQHRFEFTPLHLKRPDGSQAEVFEISSPGHKAGGKSQTPLIGRQRELRQLQDAWQRSLRGRSQPVWLTGEAGLGKTRLVTAFHETLSDQDVKWIQLQPPPYAQEAPYALLRQLLQRLVGDEGGVAGVERPNKETIATHLDGWQIPGQLDFTPILEILSVDRVDAAPARGRALAGLVEARRRVNEGRLAVSLGQLLARLCRDQPLILALEDAHQADESSLAVLERALPRLTQLPILVIAVSRPGWDPPRIYQEISLPPLTSAETEQLLAALLASDDPLDELAGELTRRGGGNPLFLQALVSTLLDSRHLVHEKDAWTISQPLSQLRTPDTIQRAIESRVETLSLQAQQVLQAAAVVGPVFQPEMIAKALGEPADLEAIQTELAELEYLGFLVPGGPYLAEYHFAHPLMREVVYARTPAAARRHYHHYFGQGLRQRLAAGEEISLSLIAQHLYLSVAGEGVALHQMPADEVDQAVDLLVRVGASAQQRYASHEAATAYRRAVTLIENRLSEPAQREPLATSYRGLGEAQEALGNFEEARAAYERAFGLLRSGLMAPADRRRAADTARRIGRLLGWQFDYEPALRWMHEGRRELADGSEVADKACAALLELHSGSLYYMRDGVKSAHQYWQKGFELAKQANDQVALAEAHNLLGVAFTIRGQRERAMEHYQASYDLYETIHDRYQLARVGDNISIFLIRTGNWDKAFALNEQRLRFWREIDDPEGTALTALNIGMIYLYRGRWKEAEAHFTESRRLSEEVQDNYMLAHSYHSLGLLHLAQGAISQGQGWLERSLALLLKHNAEGYNLVEIYWGLAEAAALSKDGPETLAQAQIALNLAREDEMPREESIALRLLGLGYYLSGDLTQAEAHLKESLAVAEQAEIVFEVGRSLVELGQLLGESGRVEEGLAYVQRAEAIFEQLKAAPMLARAVSARKTLAGSATSG